ncbi:hypothetical protein ADUPG1_006967 [Aduncisulcus paluster]|uniref:Protein kinase domain-containing protein n=1 Tax=Aduncisulcus paluster TaxID=2918883 RepID=A0ABQ5KLV4_9EUKA|nr:hypothetical protein ADUPG1_006967 [Aduncisulcus paluster]
MSSTESSSTDAVIQTVEPEFVHKGDWLCCPIPGDSPNIKIPKFESLKARDETKKILFVKKKEYYQSYYAQKMMKGEWNEGHFTHISIPFSSSSQMKGVYICLWHYISPPSHLIFSFTSSKGDKTSKKYEFHEFDDDRWYFLPVDLPDVVLCEITGKGRKKEYFRIESLVFISREETPEEIKSREAKEILWSEAPVVKPEFVKEGDRKSKGRDSVPIARDDPKLVDPSFTMVKCKFNRYSKESEEYDQSSRAQKMLKGECGVCLSHFSILFPSPSPMKGAYICVNKRYSSPSLLFTFTDCDGKKTCKKYEFTKPKHEYEWHFLPIDLDNIVLCEIEGKGMWKEKNSRYFCIYSLVFLRGDDIPTSPPLLTPIPSSSSKTPTSTFSLTSKPLKVAVKEAVKEEQKQEEIVIKGNDKDPTLKDTKQKKYKDKKKHNPKDGKPKSNPKHDSLTLTSASTLTSQCIIGSGGFGEVLLVLIDGIPFPCVLKKMLRIADKTVVKECRKGFKVQLKLFTNPKCFNHTKQKKYKDKKKHNPKDGKPKSNPKHDSLTLTSASTLTSQCIIGSGGFGEVLLVLIDGIPFPCVLKKMLRIADKTVVKECRKEFKVQLKLFTNPKCFNRIPRPLYILDLLDSDMKGVYGFLMEFCVGGSVSAFAKRWCADGKYVSIADTVDDSEPSDLDSSFGSGSESDDHDRFDPMILNPVKVCSLCVGMIECIDDVFTAKPKLVHRDVKPDNFLVRVDPDSKKCTVVLADLGFVQIQDSISSSTSSQQITSSISSTKGDSSGKKKTPQDEEEEKDNGSNCGTLVYNSYETLMEGLQTQSSDGYSLGLSILSLFTCLPPFLGHPGLRGIIDSIQFMAKLSQLMTSGMTPKLSSSSLFKSLLTIEDGKYEPVHKVFNEVFTGLTLLDVDKRMSVHEARVKVQCIKPFLPTIGEDYACPSIEAIICEQCRKYGGSVGTIEGECGVAGFEHDEGWDRSQ